MTVPQKIKMALAYKGMKEAPEVHTERVHTTP